MNAMIKFILLLPIKIIGVVFLAIGAILDGVNRRKLEREKQAARAAMEQQKAMKAAAARIEKEKREQARAEKERAADLERKNALQFKAAQAGTDIEHYKVQRAELLKLYDELEKQFKNAGTDKQKEVVFRKQIALNNQIRGVDRQIEKAQFTINRAG